MICSRSGSCAGIVAPTGKCITFAGKSTLGQLHFFVISCGNSIHAACRISSVLIKFYGITDRRPLCRISHIGSDCRFRRQLILAVEPALKGVAFFRRVLGHFCRSERGVPCHNSRACCFTVVYKCYRIGIAPDRIKIGVVFYCDLRAVGVDHCAARFGRPACKHLAGVGEGVRLQRTLAAVDVLGVVITRTAIGMESDNERRAVGEIAQVYAVVIPIAAVILRINNRNDITLSCVNFKGCPINQTAYSIYQFGIAIGDRQLIKFLFCRYLVLKAEIYTIRHGKLQGTGRITFSIVTTYQNGFAVQRRYLPLIAAIRIARFRFRRDLHPIEILA